MNRAERIESYSQGYEKVISALNSLPKEMWNFKPAPEKWSVHEILIHLADSEVNGYSRARKMIAEPGSSIFAYDQDKLAARSYYRNQNAGTALELFKWLRKMSSDLLRILPEETWSNSVFHPEHGNMTLEDWLINYDEHVEAHIKQMERNLAAWHKEPK
jgi:uncharacterized damage-inducible protein DinB